MKINKQNKQDKQEVEKNKTFNILKIMIKNHKFQSDLKETEISPVINQKQIMNKLDIHLDRQETENWKWILTFNTIMVLSKNKQYLQYLQKK